MKTTTIEVIIPDWAKWIAQDEDGPWWAFSIEPIMDDIGCWTINDHREMTFLCDGPPNPNWRETLRKVE